MRGKKGLTISHIATRDNFKFFLDIWVEKTIEVEPVWAFLPAR